MMIPIKQEDSPLHPFLFSVSVPKRIHKKAVSRNLLKRRIREAYRKNKPASKSIEQDFRRYALMYILVDKTITNSEVIERSMRRLNKKLEQHIHQTKPQTSETI